MTTPIKVLGKEYRVRGDIDPEHLAKVSDYLDDVLHKVMRTTPDTHDAVILAALNIASELLVLRETGGVPLDRIQALIDLMESA